MVSHHSIVGVSFLIIALHTPSQAGELWNRGQNEKKSASSYQRARNAHALSRNMLALPVKRTDAESVDWAASLHSFISRSYATDLADSLRQRILR